ncbi:MAG: hypothetical protein HFK06_04800 [Clostridia bacterium]|nr:hypothetical protein [Clostridia bacterium]
MGKDLVCPLCGEPTSSYMGNYRRDRLCKKHASDLKNGIIEIVEFGLDEADNTYRLVNFVNKQNEKIKKENLSGIDLKCIICNQNSNGMHFCRDCYSKYRDRAVDIRITNCSETEILDDYGNLKYKCADGRKVRSRAEAMISDWLFNNKIRSVYEETIYYDGEKTLHPDFYLPDYGLYIEYNELKNKSYLESKEYVKNIYNKIGLKVFVMTEKELQDISACLKPLLGIH